LSELLSFTRQIMNIYLFASVESGWLLAGWTMIHFLWLGALVTVAVFAGRWMLRRASANARYAVALSCFALLAALPPAIAACLATFSPPLKVADSPWRGWSGGGTPIVTAISPAPPIFATAAETPLAGIVELYQQANAPALAAPAVASAPVATAAAPIAEPSPNPSLSGRGILLRVALLQVYSSVSLGDSSVPAM
jgi:hypothetical protein